MSNSFELEILPDSLNRIKSRGLLTWVYLIGAFHWYPYFVFTGLNEVEEIGLEAYKPMDPKIRKAQDKY